MTSTIRFCDHHGRLLDVFSDLPTTPRSWVLNAYGRCEFSVPLDHAACKESLLRFGNLVHIEHVPSGTASSGYNGKLPDWVGIILAPRTWSTNAVSVVAYSAEAILAYRAMPFVDNLSGTPDQVFKAIMDYSYKYFTGDPPLRFALQQIDTSQTVYSDNLRTNAYDHIRKLATSTGMEWNAGGTFETDHINLYVNFTNRQASLPATALTPENTEEANPLLTEQGVPWNQIFAYNQANTPADRIMQEVDNRSSIDTYGPFQINQIYVGVTDAAGLIAAAQSQSEYKGIPQRVFKRVALDKGTTFAALRPGYLATVNETRVGFNASGGFGFTNMVRVLSMDYNDTSNKVTLNVEILPPVQSDRFVNTGPIDSGGLLMETQ